MDYNRDDRLTKNSCDYHWEVHVVPHREDEKTNRTASFITDTTDRALAPEHKRMGGSFAAQAREVLSGEVSFMTNQVEIFGICFIERCLEVCQNLETCLKSRCCH